MTKLVMWVLEFQPFLRFWGTTSNAGPRNMLDRVSTLLEILGLVWLVVVGF